MDWCQPGSFGPESRHANLHAARARRRLAPRRLWRDRDQRLRERRGHTGGSGQHHAAGRQRSTRLPGLERRDGTSLCGTEVPAGHVLVGQDHGERHRLRSQGVRAALWRRGLHPERAARSHHARPGLRLVRRRQRLGQAHRDGADRCEGQVRPRGRAGGRQHSPRHAGGQVAPADHDPQRGVLRGHGADRQEPRRAFPR